MATLVKEALTERHKNHNALWNEPSYGGLQDIHNSKNLIPHMMRPVL